MGRAWNLLLQSSALWMKDHAIQGYGERAARTDLGSDRTSIKERDEQPRRASDLPDLWLPFSWLAGSGWGPEFHDIYTVLEYVHVQFLFQGDS